MKKVKGFIVGAFLAVIGTICSCLFFVFASGNLTVKADAPETVTLTFAYLGNGNPDVSVYGNKYLVWFNLGEKLSDTTLDKDNTFKNNNSIKVYQSDGSETVTSNVGWYISSGYTQLGIEIPSSAFLNAEDTSKVGSSVVYIAKGTKIGGVSELTNDIYFHIKGSEAANIKPLDGVKEYVKTDFAQQDSLERYCFYIGGGDGTKNNLGSIETRINDSTTVKLWLTDYGNGAKEILIPINYSDISKKGTYKVELLPYLPTNWTYFFKNKFTFWIIDGAYTEEKPVEYTDITFANTFNIRTDDFYIEFAGAPKSQEFKRAGNVSIMVNDESCSVGFYIDTAEKYGMVLPFDKAPKDKVNKVVIKAGEMVYDNTKNLNDITFYVSGYGVFSEKEAHATTVNLSGAIEKSEKIWWNITNLNGLVNTVAVEQNGVKIYGYGYNPDPGVENSTENLYETLADVFAAEVGSYPHSVDINVKAMLVRNVQGASIRLSSDYQGLRFTAETDEITDNNVADYGMYVTSEAFLNNKLGNDFKNITDGTNGNVISFSKGMREFYDSEKQCKVYAAVINVSPVNYNKKFTACAFIKVKYTNGLEKIILADNPIARSAYEVATTAIADVSANYNDIQKSYIQKYIDGVVDIDYNYKLIGAERSYSIEKVADGEIKVTAKNGSDFNVNGILAFSINGIRKSATFENGTIKFDSSEIIVRNIADEIAAQGRSERQLQITSYFGPSLGIAMENGKLTGGNYRPSSIEDIKKYFEAGFDFLVADEADYEAYRVEGIDFGAGSGVKDGAKRMLDLVALYCDVYGITEKKYAPVVIYDSVIWTVMDAEDIKALNKSDKELEDLLTYYFNSLDGYKPEYPSGYKYKTNKAPLNCFSGFTLRDEPYGEDLELYNKWYNFLATSDGLDMLAKGYYLVGAIISPGVNRQYLKGYANDDYTLASDEEYYEHYMKYVVDSMKNNTADNSKQYLMTDCYPFLTELSCSAGKKISAKNVISEHYFGMMQTYAYNAKINGFKAATCIQTTTHYNIDKYNAVMKPGILDSKTYTLTGRINNKGEVTMNKNHIRYQAYMSLAYGMQRIDYFTYWQHYNQTAAEKTEQVCVMWKYNSETNEYVAEYQPMYDWCKETNAEMKNIDQIVLAFDWLGTKLVAGQTTGNVYGDAISYDGNVVADSATSLYDLAVGCFTLGSAYDGYMLVNADDPSDERINEVSMHFGNGYSYAVCYKSGTPMVMPLNSGIFNIKLLSGDGVFVVPIR